MHIAFIHGNAKSIIDDVNERRYMVTKEEGVFERGDVVVVTGPQGSGKSTYAAVMAKKLGTFARISLADLDSPFALSHALDRDPDSLIIETNGELRRFSSLTELIRQDVVTINPKHCAPKTVTRPLIFVVANSETTFIDRGTATGRLWTVRL